LGEAGDVHYYWIDSRAFRQARGKGLGSNFAACLGHWWAAMRHDGLDRELDQQIHLVLARCYPVVSQAKSMQDVYIDAHLAHVEATKEGSLPALSPEVLAEVEAAAARRDRSAVKQLLDDVFERQAPPAREMPAFQEALRHWAGNGVVALRRDDLNWRAESGSHLFRWLQDVEKELAKYRRRGGQPRVRQFANMFSYEAKVAFYTSYSNAWVDLIPWLRLHQNLDPVSERFLRLWHHQNQPIEIAYRPTAGGLAPRPGPGVIPDVFAGQVLALHPLSAFVMNDPTLRTMVGRFLVDPEFEAIMATRRAEESATYWGLVQAVLTAAAMYRQQRMNASERRGVRVKAGEATRALSGGAEMLPENRAFEEYAAARKLRCGCGDRLHYQGHEPVPGSDDCVRVRYACSTCSRSQTHKVTAEALRQFLIG
jgi:hypothetical protein